MRTDICEGCVCDKFLQTDYYQDSGLRAYKFILVSFISQVDFHFLSADFIMILKGQSMSSASADEISLATPLFDNLFLLSWNPRL